MSKPDENKDREEVENHDTKPPENLFRMLDDLLAHTNSSRRIFLIFIASALFFAPVALVLGGILIGHPIYNIRQIEETEEGPHSPGVGTHLQLVTSNGTVIRDFPAPDQFHKLSFIFLGIRVFIIISIIFAGILLFIAIKEYRFFARWNNRFNRYNSMKEKIDKELGDD